MKTLILLMALMTSVFANDSFTNLEDGDSFIETISNGRVLSKSPMCPDGVTCFVDGTIVAIELPLGGCLDRLGTVTYSVSQNDEGSTLNVTAIRIANKRSLAAFCIKQPTQIINISLPNIYDVNEVNFLKGIHF